MLPFPVDPRLFRVFEAAFPKLRTVLLDYASHFVQEDAGERGLHFSRTTAWTT